MQFKKQHKQSLKITYWIFFAVLFFLPSSSLFSQTTSDSQLWLDGEFNYTYKQRFLFQDELSYQTLLSGGSRWYSLNTTPAFEYNINPHFDLVSAIPLSFTRQNHVMSTFEVRTMVGTRVYFTPERRSQLRLLVRLEERWTYDRSSDEWDTGNRIRLRGEFLYPINKKSYFEDKMWYGVTDAELFLSTSDDINERFANRTRFRIGVGYRLNYNLRFEGFYMLQFSRNTIDDKFNSESNIIRLRMKYYFK